ncbi:MAG: phosphatidylinositol-specific phospholipase C domain-containing protein [Treponema sp.]|nr:phosphatidylinositol-specific phospholipase C domain-containing protein [Treponema sp.]
MRKASKVVLVMLLFAGVVACALVCMSGILYPDGKASAPYEPQNWMSALDGSKKLSELNIPGTHDSATRYINFAYFLQDQNTDIRAQLESGFRYFDLRVKLAKDASDLCLCHNFGDCRTKKFLFSKKILFKDVVAIAARYLAEHNSEAVIFAVKHEHAADDMAKVKELLNSCIDENELLWYIKNDIPTLDEVRGKIVLARRYDDERGINFQWKDQGDCEMPTAYGDEAIITSGLYLFVQDCYRYDIADKWRAVETVLDACAASDTAFSLNFLSTVTCSPLPHPKKYAAQMNARFLEKQLQKGARYGIVIFDFATTALAQHVIESNSMQQARRKWK